MPSSVVCLVIDRYATMYNNFQSEEMMMPVGRLLAVSLEGVVTLQTSVDDLVPSTRKCLQSVCHQHLASVIVDMQHTMLHPFLQL